MVGKNSPPFKKKKIEGGESGSVDSDQVNILQSPKTALMLLPEIWEPIFRRLTPTDFMRVSALCPEWNQLLKPYMAKKLITQVLEFGVEGGISRDVLLKCRDLNEEIRIVAEDALHRDNSRIQGNIMEGHQQLNEVIQQHEMEVQRLREGIQEQVIEVQRLREEIQEQGIEVQRLREEIQHQGIEIQRMEEEHQQRRMEFRQRIGRIRQRMEDNRRQRESLRVREENQEPP